MEWDKIITIMLKNYILLLFAMPAYITIEGITLADMYAAYAKYQQNGVPQWHGPMSEVVVYSQHPGAIHPRVGKKADNLRLSKNTYQYGILYPTLCDQDSYWTIAIQAKHITSPHRGWSIVDAPQYLRLDSIKGEQACQYNKTEPHTFYLLQHPLNYLGYLVSPYYYRLDVDQKQLIQRQQQGKPSILGELDKSLDGTWVYHYNRQLMFMAKEISQKTLAPQNGISETYDCFIFKNEKGEYDINCLSTDNHCISFQELKDFIRRCPANYFTELYCADGEKLPGFFVEATYKQVEGGIHWTFSIDKFVCN